MIHTVSRRAGLPLLIGAACAGTVAIAGCGSGSSATAAGSGSNATTPGAKLLDEAFSHTATSSTTGGAMSIDVKGTVTSPKDKDLQALSGEARLDVSVQPVPKGEAIPPLSMAFSARGTDTDGSGKPGKGDYRGGITYVGDQFYASWQGKDYAAGAALTKKGLDALEQQWSKQGVSPTNPYGGVDPKKIAAAMDLDPGSWLKSTTVSEGGVLDGVDTEKVSGPVDPKAVADDVTHALRSLPSVLPTTPGINELSKIKDISPKDMNDAEQALSVLDATVWVGKQDHLFRKIEVQVKFDDKTGDDPSTGDFTVDITESTKPTAFSAPKHPAPITGLLEQLQQQFGGPGGPLSAMFTAPKTA